MTDKLKNEYINNNERVKRTQQFGINFIWKLNFIFDYRVTKDFNGYFHFGWYFLCENAIRMEFYF